MAQFGSPLKLLPSSAKRSKPSIDWNQCIIVSQQWHNAQNQQGRSCTSTGTGRFYNTNTGIALLQSINAKRFRTFGEMALDFVKNQISCFQFASVVVDIFDRYDI